MAASFYLESLKGLHLLLVATAYHAFGLIGIALSKKWSR
jgi:hypothetical protein